MSTRYNTGNPIESTDVRDMSDNAKNFDEFSNSTSDSFTDRLGRDRHTIDGAIRKAGFQPASFDFVTGGTLVSGDRNKAVFNPSPSGDDNWYAWQGEFPKIISPSSIPATSGGLGDNAWKPVTNNILAPTVRESIRRSCAEAGYNLVAGSFQAGFTLVSDNDVALDESSGKAYSGSAGIYSAGTSTTGFTDESDVTLRSSIGVYLEEFGAVGDASIDPVTGAVSGTDNTTAIKEAVLWMNSLNIVNPENGGAYGFKLLGKPGAAYRVTGNNIFGNQRAEAGETANLASSFYFDGNGCTFIWTPTSTNDSWVDYAATYYRPTIKNYRTLVAGSVIARAVLRSHSGPSGNVFQEGCFDDTVFIAGNDPSGSKWRAGGYIETVFDLDGVLLQDRCMCRKSKFQQFKRMFRSAAPEAVAWVMDGTSFWSWVDGANYIELTKTFSGAHTHMACDVVLAGSNTKLVFANADNYASYKNNGELYLFSPRIETRAGKQFTAVWANHGHIVIDGLNCRNGNSSFNTQSNYISCEVYNDATVTFRNSVIPSRSRMMIVARDNVTDFPGFANSYGAVFENCEFQNYEYRPEYVTALGAVTSYRDAIQGQYYARNTKVSGSKSGNGIYGNCTLYENNKQSIPVATYNISGESYVDKDILTPITPFSVIEELFIYTPADTAMTKFDVIIANQFIRTVNVPVGVKSKLAVLTATEWGIACPTPGSGAKLKIQPYNGTTAIQRAKGFGCFSVRGAVNLSDITNDDTPKII